MTVWNIQNKLVPTTHSFFYNFFISFKHNLTKTKITFHCSRKVFFYFVPPRLNWMLLEKFKVKIYENFDGFVNFADSIKSKLCVFTE